MNPKATMNQTVVNSNNRNKYQSSSQTIISFYCSI